MSALVKLSEAVKLALKGKPLNQVATELVAKDVPLPEAKTPEFPKPVEVTNNVTVALREIGKLFNKVAPEVPRPLDSGEIAHLTAEVEYLKTLTALFEARQDNIKEYIRIHLDETTEDTDARDSMGHKLLASPGHPAVVEVPGSNARWSNEFRNGRVTTKTNKLQEMYDAGEIDHKTWLALTSQTRVPDEDKITDYVLKTGDLELLAKLTETGRPVQALNLRGLKKS